MQPALKTTDITLKSTVGECDCSDFLYGYVHEPQPTLCFSAMLLLRIKSMNDKGDVPRQQRKGQNEYKRVIILYKNFIIIIVWDKVAGIIIIIVWDKVAGILPFFSPIFNLTMKVFQNYIHDSPERSDQQGIYSVLKVKAFVRWRKKNDHLIISLTEPLKNKFKCKKNSGMISRVF